MDRGEVVQAVRAILDEHFFPTRKSAGTIEVADTIVSKLEEMGALSTSKGGLTKEQLKRVAYGAAHEIIRQCIDNGELPTLELGEFLPDGYDMQEKDFDDLQNGLEMIVMTDLWEEQAKLDG